MGEQAVTKDSIREGLERLGLRPGDGVVLHSDLRKLAKARVLAKMSNCGADALIDAFLELLGPEGLLCVPTFTKTFLVGLTGQIFDPETTPSRVGSITNVVLKRPESVRSLHPTHSWAAIGKDAQGFVEGHDRTSTFGRGSVCGRMYDRDSKVVWFGTTGTTNTSTHFAEDWLDLPYMTTEDALIKDGDGWKRVPVYRSPSGPRDFYRDDCKLDQLMAGWGIQTSGQIHNATVAVMHHREFMDRLLRALIDDPCLLLKSDMDDDYHAQMYRLTTEHVGRLKKTHGDSDGILKQVGCGLTPRR